MTETVLIVDDDESAQREIIRHVVENRLHYKSAVLGGGQAIDYISSKKQPVPDIVLLDLSMPQAAGMEVIRDVLAAYPDMPIIVLTLYGDVEKPAAAIRAGAHDFLSKPVTVERLGVSIRNTLQAAALRREVGHLQRLQQGQVGFGDPLLLPAQARTFAGGNGTLSPIATFRAGNAAEKLALPVLTLVADNGRMKRLDEIEEEIIRIAIDYYGGQMSRVALALGIGRSTLYRKINENPSPVPQSRGMG